MEPPIAILPTAADDDDAVAAGPAPGGAAAAGAGPAGRSSAAADADPGDPLAGHHGTWRRWLWLALAATFAALAGGIAVLALTFEPGAFAALDRLGAPLTLALLALVAAAWAAAAARLVLLTRALGHPLRPRPAATTALAAEFGASASPAGVGGVAVRVGLLRSYGVPIAEATAVAGADFALEATSGFLIGLGILVFALFRADSRAVLDELVTGEATRRASLPLLAAVAVLIVIGLAVRWWLRRAARAARPAAARSAAGGGARPLRHRSLRQRLVALGGRSRAGLESVRVRLAILRGHPRTLALCLLLAGVQIVARYSVLPVLVWAFTGESSPFLLFLVQGTVMAISQILVAPGGGGGVELGAGALLPVFLPSALTGIVVLLWRFFTYHLNLIVGGTAFFLWMGARGRKRVVEKVRRRRG
ncbi:MAG TPA: lysylphosphatidylglycerol synthase domain-containing protein [Thermoanaerobaculia bacterium]